MDFPSPLPLSCPDCAARMPESAAFCPSCGRPIVNTVRTTGKIGSLPESVVGGLAYLTFIPAIIFLVTEPYKRNLFVRYHAIQCLLLSVAVVGAAALVKVLGLVMFFVPTVGPLLAVLMAVVAGIAVVLLWFVLVVKALQGEMFKLPLLGDLAERYAEKT
jgi:uncharacterized membrane protein